MKSPLQEPFLTSPSPRSIPSLSLSLPLSPSPLMAPPAPRPGRVSGSHFRHQERCTNGGQFLQKFIFQKLLSIHFAPIPRYLLPCGEQMEPFFLRVACKRCAVIVEQAGGLIYGCGPREPARGPHPQLPLEAGMCLAWLPEGWGWMPWGLTCFQVKDALPTPVPSRHRRLSRQASGPGLSPLGRRERKRVCRQRPSPTAQGNTGHVFRHPRLRRAAQPSHLEVIMEANFSFDIFLYWIFSSLI